MFCPQCGTESISDLKFCRACGANLKVIGKAVTLSEAIARSDSVPNKIKDLVKSLKIERVTEEVSRAMDKMNQELVQSAGENSGSLAIKPFKSPSRKKEKTPQQRREDHLVKGTIRFFSGIGLSIFLYFMAQALVGKLPPAMLDNVPLNLDPIVRIAWLVGVIPVFTGIGHVIAGLTIRTKGRAAADSVPQVESAEGSPLRLEPREHDYANERTFVNTPRPPSSVTDRTTNILEHKISKSQTNEIGER